MELRLSYAGAINADNKSHKTFNWKRGGPKAEDRNHHDKQAHIIRRSCLSTSFSFISTISDLAISSATYT